MKKFTLVLLGFCFFCNATAQKDSLTSKDKAVLDSMINDIGLLDDEEPKKNYVDLSVGFGNATFSTQNQAVNATGYTNQLVITPAVFYYFKNGINLGVTVFVTKGNSSAELYQTGLTLGYDFENKNVESGISYTRYFWDKKQYNGKSIYNNEVFAYGKYKKGFIVPGINIGFANGKYKQIDTFTLPPIVAGGQPRKIKDTTSNSTNYFSASFTIEHEFAKEKLFTDKDILYFTPVLMLNAGSDKLTTTHLNRAFNNLPRLQARKKQTSANKMQLQSLGASFTLHYEVGKFYMQPNLYLDYYLPETTENRFTSIGSLTVGFTF